VAPFLSGKRRWARIGVLVLLVLAALLAYQRINQLDSRFLGILLTSIADVQLGDADRGIDALIWSQTGQGPTGSSQPPQALGEVEASVRTTHVAEGAAVKNQSAEVSHSPRRIENKRPPATGSTQGANLVERTISTLATTAP